MEVFMKVLLTAINAKYIHSNLAVYSLRAYAGKYAQQTEIAEYTINQPMDDILSDIYKKRPDVLCLSCYLWNILYVEQLITEIYTRTYTLSLHDALPICDHILPIVAGVIARGKTSPVKEIQQFLFILRLHIISLQAIFKTAIQILPVNPNNTGRIPWALHPSFNLQRKYARFQNLGKNIQCTKVFHAENTFLILFIEDRKSVE